MDIGILRGLGTVVVFVAFIALVLWAYNGKRQKSFDDAANLPFADKTESEERDEQASGSKSE
ncbi:MAG: cbb3-type cytochrome c oxidase subunit 3 [Pseudomonas sp.]|uniref:cbb3-type cytochrome oxidase subunit 3 n=1 Tax=Pseudomonas sp. TaxID=306 RepID=UPI003390E0C5